MSAGCYNRDLLQSIQEHRAGRDYVSFRHSETFPEETVFMLGFDKWVGFHQQKKEPVQNPGREQILVNCRKEKFSVGGYPV